MATLRIFFVTFMGWIPVVFITLAVGFLVLGLYIDKPGPKTDETMVLYIFAFFFGVPPAGVAIITWIGAHRQALKEPPVLQHASRGEPVSTISAFVDSITNSDAPDLFGRRFVIRWTTYDKAKGESWPLEWELVKDIRQGDEISLVRAGEYDVYPLDERKIKYVQDKIG